MRQRAAVRSDFPAPEEVPCTISVRAVKGSASEGVSDGREARVYGGAVASVKPVWTAPVRPSIFPA